MKKLILATLFIAGGISTTAVICTTTTTKTVTTVSMDQALDELFILLKISENMKATIPYMMQSQTKSMSADTVDQFEKMMTKMTDYLGSDKFLGKIKSMYKKHFTTKEVLDIVAFYKSTTGKKFVTITPELSMEMGQLMAEDMQALVAEFQAEAAATTTK
jgi:hypothetical protein